MRLTLMLCVCVFVVFAGNTGLAAAIAAFYQAKQFANSATVGLWDASFADIAALGSLLAMARCDGPHVSVHWRCRNSVCGVWCLLGHVLVATV